MNSLTFEPVAGPLLLLVIAAILFSLLVMRPGFIKLSRLQSGLLFAFRFSVVLLTMLALVRPGCVLQVEQAQTGVVEIFVDNTRSMQLPHRATGNTRYEELKLMIERNKAAIEALDKNNIKVRWFAFDNQLTEFDVNADMAQTPAEATGEETDIGSSMFSGVQLVRNQRLLATILASDGNQNAIDPRADLNEAVRVINDAQIPLFCIPFGQADQSNQLADLAIDNLADQFAVRVNNNLLVNATLSAKGFAGQQIPVQLVVVDRNGVEAVVDTQIVPVQTAFEQRNIQLKYTPPQPGQFQMLVRAVPQASETAVANNQLPSFLTVDDRGVNVLYIYGDLRWEQKYLRAALRSDSVISIDPYPIDQRYQRSWPVDISGLLSDPKYDVIIFGDLDSRSIYDQVLQKKNMNALTDAISNGTGFLMLGGKHSFGPGLYHMTPLADYLPILMDPFESQNLDEPTRMDLHITGPIHLKPTKSHYTNRLGQGINGGDVWEELPPLNIANRFVGAKDTAQTWLESESGDKIMVTSTVGGRVMAFAGESTWKWRMEYSPQIHSRFWRQVILWLAGQDGLEGEDVWISMPQRRFQLGQEVSFATGITSPNDADIPDASISAQVVTPEGERFPIDVQSDAEDFAGKINRDQLKSAGFYAIEVTGKSGDREIGKTKTEFVVFDNDREKSVSGADPELMARLAYQTQQWGGRVVQPEAFDELLAEIAQLAPDNKIVVPRRWRLGDTWKDALGFVVLFVGLLGCDWFLRKKWGLV